MSFPFFALRHVAKEQTNSLQEYDNTDVLNIYDNEQESPHPIHDSFWEPLKPAKFQKITNFGRAKIKLL